MKFSHTASTLHVLCILGIEGKAGTAGHEYNHSKFFSVLMIFSQIRILMVVKYINVDAIYCGSRHFVNVNGLSKMKCYASDLFTSLGCLTRCSKRK